MSLAGFGSTGRHGGPVFADQGSAGLYGISNIYVGFVEFTVPTVHTTLVEETDGFVAVVINLLVAFSLGRQRHCILHFRIRIGIRGQAEDHTVGCAVVAVLPAIGVQLHKHGISVGTEHQGLGLVELALGLGTFSTVHVLDNRVGVANYLIIVVPRVSNISGTHILVKGMVPYGGPTSLVAALEVIAKVSEPGLDYTFAIEALGAPILSGHHFAHTVDGQIDVFGSGKDGGRRFCTLGSGFHIILGAGRGQGESRNH